MATMITLIGGPLAGRTLTTAVQYKPGEYMRVVGPKAMTHQQATHLCLTHSRNEIDPSRTTPTRIVYRTPDGQVCAYEGTLPDPSFTSQPSAPPQKRSR